MKKLIFTILLALTTNISAATPQLGAIATAHPLATEVGFEVLAAGGNAFDAAVAISAVLGVVEPSSSGFGGGGFWLLHDQASDSQVMIDGREKAPAAADRDMYLDDQGEFQRLNSLNGPLAAGIPGLPAALVTITRDYGKRSLADNLASAERIAREGFVADQHYLRMAKMRLDALTASPAASIIFLDHDKAPATGFLLRQKNLADTIQAMRDHGHKGFYAGPVAEKLVAGVTAAGGIWTLQDLEQYAVVKRQPIRGTYHGLNIITAAPPSSGGIALVTILNILEQFDLQQQPSLTRKHLIIEAMRRGYRDRAQYLGDADFVEIPYELLLSKEYAAGLRAGVRTDRASKSDQLPGRTPDYEGTDTTHFSVIDMDGNRVAGTLSINIPFGSAFVPPGTGVLLNDEMDDFSAKEGVPNAYGLVGAEANSIQPGKRPLSSMTPTFVERGDQVAILGTPGGSRIISMVLLGLLEFAEGADDPAVWTASKRYHQQYLPDEVQFEKGGLDQQTQDDLEALGHTLKELTRNYGNMQAIYSDPANGVLRAAADPRRKGLAEVR
ncbi:MAG: gamma-glutamyltransferase [Gammaproteobacteria bacterium]|nr:MAG: gamma-glutamyltransferase [Gammaproteobacteria bacterium]